jgi:signal transduction histidine kinase/CheY-like chemotaxis protein
MVLGGLFFGHRRPGVFTERTERLVVGVAAQAAVALDNAVLYQAAQGVAEERQRLLERERTVRAAAERASAMKDEFLATLSHELRTPLTAILGWARMLQRPGVTEGDRDRGLSIIDRNTRAQIQLIEDLLDMSRITSGRLHLDTRPVAPATFIEAALETVRPAAEAKGIEMATRLEPGAGPVAGDPDRLQQVVWNLLANAIKFTGEGGRVEVELRRLGSAIEISVSDSGIGMAPEFLPHVFDRFRQADGSTTRAVGGLGLGLAIVKQLVELHGGSVRAESPGPERGATFTVQLPALALRTDAGGDWLDPGTAGPALEFRRLDLSGIAVLVVDDDVDARELIERALADCHAVVWAAGTAAEALELVERVRPQVLVSDIGMPGVDGYELLRRVRGLGLVRGGGVPAVALTAFARSEDRTRALRAGFLAHVPKPVDPSELIATVASVVGRAGEPALE